MTVQGRTVGAFWLAIVEVIIWVTVARTVINQLKDQPLLVVFYSFGYATGNVVGILVERRLSFGLVVLRVISQNTGNAIAQALRDKGQPVTQVRTKRKEHMPPPPIEGGGMCLWR